MRIAILCEYPTLNGGERSLLAALARVPGDAVTPLVLAPPVGPLADAVRAASIELVAFVCHAESGARLPHEVLREALLGTIDRVEPALVHANSLAMGRLLGSLADSVPMPTSAHLRDIIKLSRAAIDDLNRHQRLIAVSHATAKFHMRQGLDASRTVVLHNGVDLDRFKPCPATGWLRRELCIPDDALLIATIGQIGLRKGQNLLAKAAAMLGECPVEMHFLLIGERHSTKPESIAFDEAITRDFASLGQAGHLHRLGHRTDVARLLCEVDLLVHPAHQEPLGRVLLEAAACGCAIIATNVGGTPEILVDGESALLVPPDDARALATAIRRLSDSPDARTRLGHHARQRAAQHFAIDPAARGLLNIWESTANGRPRLRL